MIRCFYHKAETVILFTYFFQEIIYFYFCIQVFILFFSKNPSLSANSLPVPQKQIFGISHLFHIWSRPWLFITKNLFFPIFQESISIFAPQFSLSSSPKTLYSVPIYSLFLKNKFLLCHLLQIWSRPWGFVTKNLFLPSFKKLFPFFAPHFSIYSSPKTLQWVWVYCLFLKNKFLVSHLFQIWPRSWGFFTKNLFSPSFKKLFPFFAPHFLIYSSPKTLHWVRVYSLFLKKKFLVSHLFQIWPHLDVSLPPCCKK
jgi:hypothetical protein